MNKIKKIIIFIVMALMVLTINCYAATTCNEIETSAGVFKNEGESQLNKANISASDITGEVLPITQMLSVAGILIIGIAMVVLGIQWVMAKPSPEAQAKLKTKFVSLAIAAGVLFGSYTIWSIVVTIMDSIDG